VQLFLQKPYIEGGTEKAAVELVNYAKTDVLEPNESCEVTLRVDKREFASYDAYNAKTYVLDGGDYYLTVAADAHTALNNILLNKSQANTEKMISIGKDESSQSLAKKITLDTDTKTYSVSETGVEITNQFDNADLTSDYWSGDANYKSFKYISRNDWAGTTNYFTVSGGSISPAVKLTRTSKITTESDRTYGIEEDNGTYPTMGSTKTSYQLIDLRVDENGEPRAYDDPMWDDLLDQLTWDDMYNLLSYGFASTRAVTSITKPATYDYDSDLGVIQSYGGQSAGLAAQNNDPDKDEKPACYLDNSIVAATRNLKLLREYGEQWGEDCLWAGYNGLYGTGANIHRSPYGGRNYGYFSEDPYLAGASIAQMNLGMKSKGVFMLLKHCMLNEQETNRCGASSWANEQSIREIYLKVFQIAIEDGEVQGVMTSLNRIGATAAPHHNFLNTVLRGEFGMRGYNVTDSYMGYMHIGSCVLAGNDLPLAQDSDLKNYQTGYSKIAWAMRDSVHNILYTTVHSRAMNGISSNMRVVSFQPEWQYYLEYYTPIVKKFAIISILLYFSMELFVDNPLLFERRKKPKVQ
jgi:beta-glucosidase